MYFYFVSIHAKTDKIFQTLSGVYKLTLLCQVTLKTNISLLICFIHIRHQITISANAALSSMQLHTIIYNEKFNEVSENNAHILSYWAYIHIYTQVPHNNTLWSELRTIWIVYRFSWLGHQENAIPKPMQARQQGSHKPASDWLVAVPPTNTNSCLGPSRNYTAEIYTYHRSCISLYIWYLSLYIECMKHAVWRYIDFDSEMYRSPNPDSMRCKIACHDLRLIWAAMTLSYNTGQVLGTIIVLLSNNTFIMISSITLVSAEELCSVITSQNSAFVVWGSFRYVNVKSVTHTAA